MRKISFSLTTVCVCILLLLLIGCSNDKAENTETRPTLPVVSRGFQTIKIPSGPEAILSEHRNRMWYSWMYRNTVEAYLASQAQTNPCPPSAESYLDLISQIESGVNKNPNWPGLESEGRSLAEAGCRDSLVNLWYGISLFKNDKVDEAEPIIASALQQIEASDLPSINRFFGARAMLEIYHYRLGDLRCKCNKYLKILFSSLAAALDKKEFFGPEMPISYHLLYAFRWGMNYEDTWEDMLDALKDNENIDPYLTHLVQGEFAILEAWRSRGGSWAKDVTAEGWEGFKKNLATAREHLTKAWKLNPGYPEAPALMIRVAQAGQAGEGETEITWFNRSVAAQMDYKQAYYIYFDSLEPRWGGSYHAMIDFGRTCMETKRFDTDVPMYYLVAMRMVGGDLKHNQWRQPFRQPVLTVELETLFEGMLHEPARTEDHDRIITQYAITNMWQGDYEKAKELLASVTGHVDLRNGFAGKGISWSVRPRETVETELRLFTGPDKEQLIKAEQYNLDNKFAMSNELFVEVMDKYRDDPEAFAYLRDRVGLQMIEAEPMPVHWTPLHLAAMYSDEAAAKFLLDNGEPLDTPDRYGFTPLNSAASNNALHVAYLLLSRGADMNKQNNRGETPLYNACLQGNEDLARFLIEHGADIHPAETYGFTALHSAVIGNLPAIVELLLDKGADINTTAESGYTPLITAMSKKFPEIINLLIEKGADVNVKVEEAAFPLLHYAGENDLEMVRLLIDHGADVNVTAGDNWTALVFAANSGNVEMAQLLIEHGADVNVAVEDNWTPLHFAAVKSNNAMAALLLQHDADIERKVAAGETPILFSAANDNLEMTRLLIDHGADVNIVKLDSWAPLHFASSNGNEAMVDLLLQHGAASDLTLSTGDTPLMFAADKGNFAIARLLIEHGADVNATKQDNWTPLHFAAASANVEMAQFLLQNKAALEIKSATGETPFMFSVGQENLVMARLLIEHGADVNVTNPDKWTPLHYVAYKGNIEFAQLLLQNEADPGLKLATGETPLEVAKTYKNNELVALLSEKSGKL